MALGWRLDEDIIPEQVLGVYTLDLTEFPDQGAELDRGGALCAGHLGTGQLRLLTPSCAHTAVT